MAEQENKVIDMIDNELAWLDAMVAMKWSPAFENDPVREVLFAETIFGFITGYMQDVGFIVPEVTPAEDDPLAFCKEAAAVLRKFRPFLAPFVWSPFAPKPPEIKVQ